MRFFYISQARIPISFSTFGNNVQSYTVYVYPELSQKLMRNSCYRECWTCLSQIASFSPVTCLVDCSFFRSLIFKYQLTMSYFSSARITLFSWILTLCITAGNLSQAENQRNNGTPLTNFPFSGIAVLLLVENLKSNNSYILSNFMVACS